jgi:hypothetical protein
MSPRGMLYVATWHVACGALQRRSSRPLRRVPTSSLRCAYIRRGSKQHSHKQHSTYDVQHATSVQSAVISSARRVGAKRDAALHLRAAVTALHPIGRCAAPVTACHRQERERAAESDRLALRAVDLRRHSDGTRAAALRRHASCSLQSHCTAMQHATCSTQLATDSCIACHRAFVI